MLGLGRYGVSMLRTALATTSLGLCIAAGCWALLWPAALGLGQAPPATNATKSSEPLRPLPVLRWHGDAFLGSPDAPRLDRMRQGHIVKIKKGGGGRSLGFKLYFSDGTKAYFKPDQAFTGTNWYAEIAAYHIDRLLGMGRVPPVVAHRMPWKGLRAVAGKDRRVEEVHVLPNGTVVGALVYWLPKKLQPAVTPPGWENWLRIAPYARWSVTPYQRAKTYGQALRERKQRGLAGKPARSYYEDVPVVTQTGLPAALSDMLVLDFLTLNIDRWGGNNANVLMHGDGDDEQQLIFLDNAAGFSHGPHRRGLMDDRLAPQQKFRRSTVAALRSFSLPKLRRRLEASAGAPILDDALLEGIEVRRGALLQRIEALIDEHGRSAVLAWP